MLNPQITIGALILISSVNASAFSDEQKQLNPCLTTVALPWSISLVKPGAMPPEFKNWSAAYTGHWNENDGSKVCTAVFIGSVRDNGYVRATYTNADPYKRVHMLTGGIKTTDGRQTLTISNDANTWSISYVLLEDGKLEATTWTGKTGSLQPVR